MRTLSRSRLAWAATVSATAGFIDAIGFVLLGGYFVSFMSGNSTRSGVELVSGHVGTWLLALLLVASFTAGVVLASLLGHRLPSARLRVVLLFSVILTAIAAAVAPLDVPPLSGAVLAAAMGALNTVFTQDGEVRIPLTYMTGTLVKLGQGIALALTGSDRGTWPRYLALWAAITVGAILGAATFALLGAMALWLATAALIVCTVLDVVLPRRRG